MHTQSNIDMARTGVVQRPQVVDNSSVLLWIGDDSEVRPWVDLRAARLGLIPIHRLQDNLVASARRRNESKAPRTICEAVNVIYILRELSAISQRA